MPEKVSGEIWSGKRDSNSRPQPWQGCALPTELFPQIPGGAIQSRTGLDGFAIRCITALLSRRGTAPANRWCRPPILTKKGSTGLPFFVNPGAGNETRTRDLNLGKVALYQLSYSRRYHCIPTASPTFACRCFRLPAEAGSICRF